MTHGAATIDALRRELPGRAKEFILAKQEQSRKTKENKKPYEKKYKGHLNHRPPVHKPAPRWWEQRAPVTAPVADLVRTYADEDPGRVTDKDTGAGRWVDQEKK